jgi:hypothetical protein
MKRSILSSIAIAAAFLAIVSAAGAQNQKGPVVEVAFVLDSTGSMGGLIEGAKRKIWSIANSIADWNPSPEIRIGLISYRDRGDEYITKRFDLTDDIDAVFERLMSFQAGGGGDGPESVNQALNEAVTRLSWSEGGRAVKIVFLVGDYPPHMDYSQDVKYYDTCAIARKRGIIINTVQCGDFYDTTPVWKEIARLGAGDFVALAQSGNMAEINTPYDDELSRKSSDLGSTVLAYGSSEEQSTTNEKLRKAAEAPASVAADRATFNAKSGGRAVQGRGDILSDMEEEGLELSKVKDSELPPELKKMKPAEREAYVASLKKKRDALNADIAELTKKRAAYIAEEQKRQAASSKEDSFDLRVSEIINEQLENTKK